MKKEGESNVFEVRREGMQQQQHREKQQDNRVWNKEWMGRNGRWRTMYFFFPIQKDKHDKRKREEKQIKRRGRNSLQE